MIALPPQAPPTVSGLSEADFNFFREQLRNVAGISLSAAKRDLLQSRLRERLSALGLSSHAEYRSYLENLPGRDGEWQCFINCLTTNKTDWFREPAHFALLESSFLPKWLSRGGDCLQVWCAASSTGEEPYTLSLVLNRALRPLGKTYRILATDIDTKVLAHARNGVYSRARVEEQVPAEFHSFFVPGRDGLESWVKVKREIKQPITFAPVNLARGLEGEHPKFDLIFLRNVLIYFDRAGVSNVVNLIHPRAADEALLVIAHSESLQNTPTPWRYLKPSVYRKGTYY